MRVCFTFKWKIQLKQLKNSFISLFNYARIAGNYTLNDTFINLTISLAMDEEIIHQKIKEFQSLYPILSVTTLDAEQINALESTAVQILPNYATEVIKLRIYKRLCIKSICSLMKLTKTEV